MDRTQYGYETGETCGRKGCKGIVAETKKGVCSCHINPPCFSCTEDRAYCPECDWHGKDDEHFNDTRAFIDLGTKMWAGWEPRKLDSSKIDWHSKAHTHFSMVKEGVYPEGTTQAEVEKQVKGSFGGRFESFAGGRFKYVAYTD